jgi:hypothetical protein
MLRVWACFMLARVSTPSSPVRERERKRERESEKEGKNEESLECKLSSVVRERERKRGRERERVLIFKKE